MASGTTGTSCSPWVSCSPVPGFGVLPCAGAYAQVVRHAAVHWGDTVTLA